MATNPQESIMLKKVWDRLRGHFQEYVSRYSVLALAVLTPAAGLLGELAADLGGVGTGSGRVVLAAASALGTAAAGVVFIRNLGIWQMLDTFGKAPGVAAPVAVAPVEVAPTEVPVRAQVTLDGKTIAESVAESVGQRGIVAESPIVEPVDRAPLDAPPREDEDNSVLESADGNADPAAFQYPADGVEDPVFTGPDLFDDEEDDDR